MQHFYGVGARIFAFVALVGGGFAMRAPAWAGGTAAGARIDNRATMARAAPIACSLVDAGRFASNAIAARLGNVAGGQVRTVTFQVQID